MDRYLIGSSVAFTVAFATEMDTTVKESRSIISIALTDDATLNISSASQNVIGDEIIVKASSDGTARDLTFGTGFTAPALAGVISKTKVQSFVFDGTSFIASGAPVQLD